MTGFQENNSQASCRLGIKKQPFALRPHKIITDTLSFRRDIRLVLWMVTTSISHDLRNHAKPFFVGIYRGIESFQGFLGGAGFRPSTASRTMGHNLISHSYPRWQRRRKASTELPIDSCISWFSAEQNHCSFTVGNI